MQVPVPQSIVALDAYFLKQRSLIPEKYFLDADHGSAQGLRFLKKDVRASTKRKLVEVAKERKRAKLNPDNDSVDQGRGSEGLGGAAGGNTAGTDEGPTPQKTFFKLSLGKDVPRKGLEEKLQQKLQEQWDQRQVKEERGKHIAADAKNWRNRVTNKAKGDGRQMAGQAMPRLLDDRTGQAAPAPDEPLDLDFGKVQLEAGREKPVKGGKAKMSKQALLREAERNAEQKDELQQSAEGKALLAKQAWRAALLRADNVKVLDDPKLLRRSVKKEQKEKQKKRQQWKERSSRQEQDKQSRQAKREEHLNVRSQAKKQKKKEKREKKLTLRPGFEGRLAGFIRGNKAKP